MASCMPPRLLQRQRSSILRAGTNWDGNVTPVVVPADHRDVKVEMTSIEIGASMLDPANVQIISPMNLNQCWKVFSAEWKKVRHEFSETSVHDFRVAIRRMISELEIVAAITGEEKSRTLIPRFKK